MHFGSKAKIVTHSCNVEGFVTEDENVHTYKYLGFFLDQELTFKADLKRTIQTISQKFYMFNISTENLHSITNTLILEKRRKFQLFVAMYKAVYSNNIAQIIQSS